MKPKLNYKGSDFMAVEHQGEIHLVPFGDIISMRGFAKGVSIGGLRD